ncbi:hypothetical protein IGK67_002899 [Enterococcus sp. AZ093]|uniref:WxL domain-containing protein n=1 Tax=Enterococcus sp. AZ093 TaxID=2774859 RepID=UPI003F23AC94
MRKNGYRTIVYICLAFLCFQLIFLPNSAVYSAHTQNKLVDNQTTLSQTISSTVSPTLESMEPNIKAMSQTRQQDEAIQTFSFVAKTFTTSVSQPVTIRFNSTLPSDEVIIRVPDEGEVLESELPQGARIERSHGEYWRLITAEKHTTFTLTVVFVTPGDYFLTVDHDTDHFYLKVMEEINNNSLEPAIEVDMAEERDFIKVDEELKILQPLLASEENLVISEDIINVEEERILEATRDEINRSVSNVSSWSQFRSAWNSSSTTVIQLNGYVRYSSGLFNSLNSRSSSVIIIGREGTWGRGLLSMGNSSERLAMSGDGMLTIQNTLLDGAIGSTVITHSGSGKVVVNSSQVEQSVAAQNILLESGGQLASYVELASNGTLEIYSRESTGVTGIRAPVNDGALKLIGSNHDIYIKGKELMLQDRFHSPITRLTWEEVDIHFKGSSEIISAVTIPDDFTNRYPGRLTSQASIILNARSSGGWVDPPLPNGEVMVTYSDLQGNSLLENEILSGPIGETYKTQPVDIPGYLLVDTPENEIGIFTVEPIIVNYVYDIQKEIKPVDPLDPDKEVDPENPPELPEEQGTLSIDFASRFSFGTQGISAQTKRYYAQPQRLLNADGSINDAEERPNYIQVSDRRPKEERHGWQLAVTQNNQFTDRQDNQLRGARLLLNNQQFASVQESNEPMLQNQDGIVLIPEEKTLLVTAHDGQGAGTWIYRFGNRESAGESVALEVPPTANPRTATYQTTLTWELSAVPDN